MKVLIEESGKKYVDIETFNEAVRVIEFYGNEKNWQTPEDQGFRVDEISLGVKDMIEEIDSRDSNCGGNLARGFLSKLDRH